MFARLTEMQFLPEMAGEGFGIVQDPVVLDYQRTAGLRGIVVLRDSNAGSASVLSLWESEADMDATATGNYLIYHQRRTSGTNGPHLESGHR
jgi:hypothetical protein